MSWIPIVVTVEPPLVAKKAIYLLKGYRNGYLATDLPQIIAYFGGLMPDPDGLFVLLHEGKELPWHWPTGVLIDYYNPTFPWVLKLANGTPAISPADVRSFWLQQMKESCYIRDGNSKSIMNLSIADTDEIWEAVRSHDTEKYASLMRPLVQSFRNVPVKIYGQKMVYKLVESTRTLGSLLNELFPEQFASTRVALESRPYLMGAEVPLQAPLGELFDFAYVDGFLHICIY